MYYRLLVISLPAEVAAATALFAGTNVDDVVILGLLNASARAGGRPRGWQIWAGQYLGLGVLTGVSVAAGRGLALAPERWLWLLALVPLGVGAISLVATISARHHSEQPQTASARGAFGVAAITILDGADDLAAYTPFFAAAGTGQVAVTIAVFAACIAVWCLAGSFLTRHQRVTATIDQHGHWILPVAFILIGVYVLIATLHLG